MTPAFRFTGAGFNRLRQPLVYVWRRSEGQVMYVGVGTNGACRPLDRQHHRLHSVRDRDVVEIYLCTTADEAVNLECRLINELKPALNRKRIPHTTYPIRVLEFVEQHPRSTERAISESLKGTRTETWKALNALLKADLVRRIDNRSGVKYRAATFEALGNELPSFMKEAA